jgi:hypothetical protein
MLVLTVAASRGCQLASVRTHRLAARIHLGERGKGGLAVAISGSVAPSVAAAVAKAEAVVLVVAAVVAVAVDAVVVAVILLATLLDALVSVEGRE